MWSLISSWPGGQDHVGKKYVKYRKMLGVSENSAQNKTVRSTGKWVQNCTQTIEFRHVLVENVSTCIECKVLNEIVLRWCFATISTLRRKQNHATGNIVWHRYWMDVYWLIGLMGIPWSALIVFVTMKETLWVIACLVGERRDEIASVESGGKWNTSTFRCLIKNENIMLSFRRIVVSYLSNSRVKSHRYIICE